MASNDLKEENFIHEGSKVPLWTWLAVLVALAAILWGGANWFYQGRMNYQESSAFNHVTNRDFSLFLWQNPEYMRVNVSNKSAYLPGFQYLDKISIEPGQADQYVIAPPKVIFLYHTWKRLVGNDLIPRPIPAAEFREFLDYAEEWKPENWSGAPEGYKNFVKDLSSAHGDLQSLSTAVLPLSVRQAFMGWKNYFQDGSYINKMSPSYSLVNEFLQRYPHYARPYWRNIVANTTPNYLKSAGKSVAGDFPSDELTSFLRVALYNYSKAYEKPSQPMLEIRQQE